MHILEVTLLTCAGDCLFSVIVCGLTQVIITCGISHSGNVAAAVLQSLQRQEKNLSLEKIKSVG